MLLFILILAAAFTSSQSGNWSSSSTWGGAGVPGNGDTVTISTGNVVSVDVDTIIGASGVNGTNAVTMGSSTSQVVINSNHLLRLRGDFQVKADISGSGNPQLLGQSGSSLKFDSSLAASPSTTKYQVKPDGGFAFGFVKFAGTSNSHATVSSDNTNGAANGYFGLNGFTQGGTVVATYTDFTNIGDSSNSGFNPNWSANGPVNWDVQNSTFTGCGLIDGGLSSPSATAIVRHNNNIHLNSVGPGVLFASFQTTLTTGVRQVNNNYFDIHYGNTGAAIADTAQLTMNDNFFYSIPSIAGTNMWSSFQRNLVRNGPSTGCTTNSAPQIKGDVLDNYFLVDCINEPHLHAVDIGNGVTTVNALRGIFDSTHLVSDPVQVNDGIVEFIGADVLTNLNVKNNIVIPTGDGKGSNALMDMWGPHHTQYLIDHNTIVTPGGAGCIMMEYEDADVPNGVATRGTLSNNICAAPSNLATNFMANLDLENPITDFFTVANVKNNNRFNLANTNPGAPHSPANQGNSYISAWSVTPGSSDVLGDPLFLDRNRNMAVFDTRYLNNAFGAQWITSHSYNKGDVVSDSSSSYYSGVTINYKCTVSHTSAAGTEPGIGSSWHTVWEFKSLDDIRNSIINNLTITDPSLGLVNSTYIVALTKWVTKGFAPRNTNLKGAASDGGDIGAVPVVSGCNCMITGSSINGSKIIN